MDDILLRSRLNRPLVTGTPTVPPAPRPNTSQEAQNGESFQKILQNQLAETRSMSFSRHAANRIAERGIDLSVENMERLREGMEMAQNKGLDDALILMGDAAFIVSARNGTIITAMSQNELKKSVITNINGTVIL